MEVEAHADGMAGGRSWRWLPWAIVWLTLFAVQGWLTLGLFGRQDPWKALLNDEPIISGRHALHLYHGYLGARSYKERGTGCCYDPAFQAGYPKTPVFDDASRPAELFLSLSGNPDGPPAYKIGLAVCVFSLPLLLWLAARAAALGPGAACLAMALGMLVCWSTPGRNLLMEGDLNTFLVGLGAVLACGLLVYVDRHPYLTGWLGLGAASCLVWFADPFGALLLFPLSLVYYARVGVRHALPWHGALLGGLGLGIVVNHAWLLKWFSSWWIRAPMMLAMPSLIHRTPSTIWHAPLWGDECDRVLDMFLLAGASVGSAILNQTKQRVTARMFGAGALGFMALAIAGASCGPFGSLRTERFLVPGLWFAALPAAHTLAAGWRLLVRMTGGAWRTWLLAMAVLAPGAFAARDWIATTVQRQSIGDNLRIGLSNRDRTVITALQENTTGDARILWEDLSAEEPTGRFTALLPVLSNRSFIGGIGIECCIEHGYANLTDGRLAGRSLANWTDSELADFCRHYNIGWVACRSEASATRFAHFPGAQLRTDNGLWLYELPYRSFVLIGQGRVLKADQAAITLVDVVPENGQVVLSFHYQTGMRASPSRVQVERIPDMEDPVPFVRLRMSSPVTRLTLTWQPR
jgi:hypothetical protein